DVRDPKRVAHDRHTLRAVESHPVAASLGELEHADRAVALEPGDEAVVVLGQWIAVDVGDKPQVELGVVARRLRMRETGDLANPMWLLRANRVLGERCRRQR